MVTFCFIAQFKQYRVSFNTTGELCGSEMNRERYSRGGVVLVESAVTDDANTGTALPKEDLMSLNIKLFL